jgi:ATP diphosphatase
MDDIPIGMSGIARSMKVQKRARSVGFDWDEPEQVISVLREEISELEDADGDAESVAAELGDVLFTTINLARHLGIDPEVALRSTVDKFIGRFRTMERYFTANSSDISEATTAELERAWQAAKTESP